MSEQIEPVEQSEAAEGATPEVEADEPLGEGGLKALKAEREAAAAAKREAAEYAAKLKEYEDRDKSEAQKLQERLEAAEREAGELRGAKLRAEVAAAKGVPAGLLSGSTAEELAASADALIEFKGQAEEVPPPRLYVPGEGRSPANASNSNDWLHDLLQR